MRDMIASDANARGRQPNVPVIHIGWHKCASTYLQQRVFPLLGANYQPLGAFPAGIPAPEGAASLIDFLESSDEFDTGLFKELLGVPHDDRLLVISSEEISGHSLGYEVIDPFVTARNLARTFPKARIVAVIRHQLDYILSLYCYRVCVRGHEYRSLERFLAEDGESGLFAHIEYDRLIAEYVSLFGRENVLVLPIELLRRDSSEFFRSLAGFIGEKLPAPRARRSNESTRLVAVVAIWRPFNRLLHLCMNATLLLSGRRPSEYGPRKRKIFPFVKFRLRYYALQRKMTRRLNRHLSTSRRIEFSDIPARRDLESRFAKSNDRLASLGVVHVDLAALGYPMPLRDKVTPQGTSA